MPRTNAKRTTVAILGNVCELLVGVEAVVTAPPLFSVLLFVAELENDSAASTKK